ncbi:hypothetical protein ES703_48230 [subsurface metagenome]
MKTETSAEQAIIKADLYHIILGYTAGTEYPSAYFSPMSQVIPGVAHADGFPGSAGSALESYDFSKRNGKHSVRIARS